MSVCGQSPGSFNLVEVRAPPMTYTGMRIGALAIVFGLGCAVGCSSGPGRLGGHGDGGNHLGDGMLSYGDGGGQNPGDGGQAGCASEPAGCYTVYAHSNNVLYRIDLMAKTLVEVGPFNAPDVTVNNKMVQDIMTDLAVSPKDDTIYTVSNTNLYTVSATDGHVTLIAPIANCGTQAVALTFTPDGNLYAADFKGALCRIDLGANPPTVTQVGTLGSGLAIAGDIVAVGDGTMYGTAYRLSDTSGGTQNNNLLVKIDPMTGAASAPIGSTGYPKLFGVAYALGQVFGFTHDGSGDVVTIDPKTGQGALYNTFKDPTTNMGISFAGAGVNADVSPTIQ